MPIVEGGVNVMGRRLGVARMEWKGTKARRHEGTEGKAVIRGRNRLSLRAFVPTCLRASFRACL